MQGKRPRTLHARRQRKLQLISIGQEEEEAEDPEDPDDEPVVDDDVKVAIFRRCSDTMGGAV